MNAHTQLDGFESALLSELRAVVETQSQVEPVAGLTAAGLTAAGQTTAESGRRPRGFASTGAGGRAPGRRRVVMVAAAAALAVVGGIGVNSLRPTPAFAVSDEGNGDTVVTIHRLDDAAGLESELAKHGIDADVNYGGSLENGPVEDHDGGVTVLPSDADPGQVGGAHWRVPAGAEEQLSSAAAEAGPQVGAGQVGPGQAGDDPCGFTGNDEAPFTTREVGSDYVITIPKDSVIRDQTLTITTFEGANNELGLITSFSAGDNTQCGVVGN